MPNIKKKVEKAVIRYLTNLSRDIYIDRAILYGSQVRGKAGKYSDIDLAIFSKEFRKHTYLKTQQILQKYLWEIEADLQPIGYSSEDYVSSGKLDFIGGVIKKEGILVCKRNKILI